MRLIISICCTCYNSWKELFENFYAIFLHLYSVVLYFLLLTCGVGVGVGHQRGYFFIQHQRGYFFIIFSYIIIFSFVVVIIFILFLIFVWWISLWLRSINRSIYSRTLICKYKVYQLHLPQLTWWIYSYTRFSLFESS